VTSARLAVALVRWTHTVAGAMPSCAAISSVVHVQEDPQRDYLALAGRQAPQRTENGGIEATVLVAGNHGVVVSQGQLASAVAPPRCPGVERGPDHPRTRGGMAADLPPCPPGTRECLGYLVFGLLGAADHSEYRPQSGIPAGLEEFGEFRLLLTHTRLTLCAPLSAYRRPRKLNADQPRP
jgi:hypothetical protein